MNALLKVLEKSEEFNTLLNNTEKTALPLGVLGLSNVHKAHWISALCAKLGKTALVLCDSEGTATKLCEDINYLSGGAMLFPERDFHFRSDDVCSREYERTRLSVMTAVLEGKAKYVICTAQAASQFTISPTELKKRTLTLAVGETTSVETVVSALVSAGYVRSEQVDGTGQFSVRGGIVDFFSPNEKEPIRIEFWGDDIDSISYFDIESQRRTEQTDKIEICPSTEVVFENDEVFLEKLSEFSKNVKGKGSQKSKKAIFDDVSKLENGVSIACADKYISLAYETQTTLFDYMTDSLLFVCETKAIKQSFSGFSKLFAEEIKAMFEEGQLARGIDKFTLTWDEVVSVYDTLGAIYVDNFARGSFDTPVRSLVSIEAGANSGWDGTISYLLEDLMPSVATKKTCVILAGTEKNASQIAKDLENEGVKAKYYNCIPPEFENGTVNIIPGTLSSGFEYNSLKFMLISYRKGGTQRSGRRVSKAAKKNAKALLSLEEISRGDYVVHESHGIGIFDGIRTMAVDGKLKDFIKVSYRGSDVLYIPVTQLDLLSKYISPKDTDKPIKLNKLGGDEWNRTKKRVRSAVKDIAAELTKIYARRTNTPGYAFSPDLDMQNDFERRFEYDETDDQLTAISEIKGDMEKTYPMDRLLCGDVGFGKTEVALRAAFKCIADGKQCAILVPTTILAFQHFQTIKKRFDGFPIEVEMISRFRTLKERNKIKKGLKEGTIDLVVGTHSIIASSVEFKDLGLLIVDEEQRFGVAQKEKLKERFPLVDVLTLSATPIPRTLNMAMTGIRDMSVLEVPPLDRHPVQTYVLEYDLQVLAEAMQRELRRGGQVYYLHNKVGSIEKTAAEIQKALPEARIGIAHGKMGEEELSEVWRQLLEAEIDILVCTTIIETGVDIPNANTLIIEDADRLGLAQLHQIRGRVGRSTRRAFAYFTFREDKQLTEIAHRRLSAIREFTQFGSGFQIALRDLEIRGAGNILGAQQHGHMEAVGYDMYLQMLSEAIEGDGELLEMPEKKDCTIDISVDAHIPDSYIQSVKNRIMMYKRIAAIETEEDAMDVLDEFIDRFGDPPKSVKGLVDVAQIRHRAAVVDIYEIRQRNDSVIFYVKDIKPAHITLLNKFLRKRVFIGADKGKQYAIIKLAGHSPLETVIDTVTAFEAYA